LKLDGELFKNVLLNAVKKDSSKTRIFLEALDPKTVALLTEKLDYLEGTEEEMDDFYEKLFSIVPDRRLMVNIWLDKKETFAKQMLVKVLHEVIGYKELS
jgi:hypothetical protein